MIGAIKKEVLLYTILHKMVWIIFVQEHWLITIEMILLNIF